MGKKAKQIQKTSGTSSLADDLRNAIKLGGKSANEIAKATGIPQPTITRFLAGADMRLSRAEKIADYFGMRLWPRFVEATAMDATDARKATKALRVKVVTRKKRTPWPTK